MALIHILNDIDKDLGATSNTGDRSLRIADINNAIKEIHGGLDLPESLDEEVFSTDVQSQQICLPARVDRVIGMRWADSRIKIDLDARANRYHEFNSAENEVWPLRWP